MTKNTSHLGAFLQASAAICLALLVACASGEPRHTSLPDIAESPESIGAEAGQDLAATSETDDLVETHDENGKERLSGEAPGPLVTSSGVNASKTKGVLGSLRVHSAFPVGGVAIKSAVSRQGKVTVTARSSGIDQRIAESVLRGLSRKMAVCYRTALSAAPRLAGTLTYKLTVDATGQVTNVILMDSRLPQPNVVGCTTRLIERVKFPRSSGGEIEAELEFKP